MAYNESVARFHIPHALHMCKTFPVAIASSLPCWVFMHDYFACKSLSCNFMHSCMLHETQGGGENASGGDMDSQEDAYIAAEVAKLQEKKAQLEKLQKEVRTLEEDTQAEVANTHMNSNACKLSRQNCWRKMLMNLQKGQMQLLAESCW